MQFSSAILQKLGKDNLIQENSVSISIGGGRRNVPPPEIGKTVVEIIWRYLPEVYTFGAESDFVQKFQNFLKKFQNSLHFWSKCVIIWGRLLIFSCPIEIIHRISMILHFSINYSRFSPKNPTIFMPFSIVLLYLSYFLRFFDRFLN